MTANQSGDKPANVKNRFPKKSVFYERVLPIIFVSFGALTVILILFALGVLLGIVKY